jgi:thiamine pyrophosphate-dependent acetolactate synthase large subunit-like protein
MAPNHPINRDAARVMNRFDLLSRMTRLLTRDEAVIGGIGYSNFDLWAAGRRPQNFYMLGSMGLAYPIAFGVALAQPERRVIALEGDGSILMQLGSFATIAVQKPRNLAMVLLDNGAYQITGGQPTASGQGTDLIAMARGAGLMQSNWAADEADFDGQIVRALREDGPFVIGCRIDNEKPRDTTERDPARIRDNFMRGLGVTA